jgi:hypothetical protein
MLLGGIAIIVTAFYMRIYCHDHTSLSAQTLQHTTTSNIMKIIKNGNNTNHALKKYGALLNYR